MPPFRLLWTRTGVLNQDGITVLSNRDGGTLGSLAVGDALLKLDLADRTNRDAIAALLTRELQNISDDRWPLDDPSLVGDPYASADPMLPQAFWVDADGEKVAISGNPAVALALRMWSIRITWDAGVGEFQTEIRRVG